MSAYCDGLSEPPKMSLSNVTCVIFFINNFICLFHVKMSCPLFHVVQPDTSAVSAI